MIQSQHLDPRAKDLLEPTTEAQIPLWFLRDYVKTSEELRQTPPPLVIRNGEGQDEEATEGNSSGGTYEMDVAFFESMCNIIRLASPQTKAHKFVPDSSNAIALTKNAMLLHYLNRYSWDNYGWRFLESVVEYFAMSINADLITLTVHNIMALALQFAAKTSDKEELVDIDGLMKLAFPDNAFEQTGEDHLKKHQQGQDSEIKNTHGDNGTVIGETAQSAQQYYSRTRFPFHDVLSAPLLKRNRTTSKIRQQSIKPLVIHLPKISSLRGVLDGAVLKSLQFAAFQSSPRHYSTNIIVIATDIENPLTSLDPSIIRMIGSNPVPKALRLVPLGSQTQKALLVKHGEFKDPGSARMHRLANIRALKYAATREHPESPCESLIGSATDWGFLDGTRAAEIFDSGLVSAVDIDDMVQEIGEDLGDENIERSILRIGRREEILDAWKSGMNGELGGDETSGPPDKWASFPDNIKKAIEDIQGDKEKYKRESEFLDLIVNPNDVEDSWDDIALDPDTKEAIQQILPGMQNVSNNDQSGYGILKRGSIGGALLYGPPGTGKTHLARVIARECKAVTICASGADIEDMYVGETEKIIKGLFNLGKMLVPSIIFIDEADALFRARQPGERSWKRSQTNQLLSEMDGLSRSKSSPFVLLATNFPNDLDHALLRRVPSRIYIGLPSGELREKILRIMLKDEELGPDLDLSSLASVTKRFSGSDIQSLCVQAALICNTFVQRGENEGKRMLGHMHFKKALSRVSPTTSQRVLVLIKQFADEFDPPGYERIISMEEKEGATQLREGELSKGHIDPRQTDI